jgi:hypothetical protein
MSARDVDLKSALGKFSSNMLQNDCWNRPHRLEYHDVSRTIYPLSPHQHLLCALMSMYCNTNTDYCAARIGSGSATERKDGLTDLEYLFRYNKNSHVIDSFKDKTWHIIFDALFSCAALERSAYLRTTQSQKSR